MARNDALNGEFDYIDFNLLVSTCTDGLSTCSDGLFTFYDEIIEKMTRNQTILHEVDIY